jgi:hypothetical protein
MAGGMKMTDQTTNPTPDPTPVAPTAQPEKTFTQAELERQLGERLARERAKYADYEELKAAKTKLEELEAGQLSERDKLQKQIEKLEKKAAEAEARALEKEQKAQEILIRSAVLSEASKLGFANPEDAYLLLAQKPTIGEDGQPAGVAEAVKALAESRPYLIRGTQSRIPTGEPFNPSGQQGTIKETDEQRRQRLYNRRGRAFDTTQAEQRGGGVIWNQKPE